jgi:hypothetical protein
LLSLPSLWKEATLLDSLIHTLLLKLTCKIYYLIRGKLLEKRAHWQFLYLQTCFSNPPLWRCSFAGLAYGLSDLTLLASTRSCVQSPVTCTQWSFADLEQSSPSGDPCPLLLLIYLPTLLHLPVCLFCLFQSDFCFVLFFAFFFKNRVSLYSPSWPQAGLSCLCLLSAGITGVSIISSFPFDL